MDSGTEIPQGVAVIAEVGSNHSGSLEQAYRLIEAAAAAEATSAKFQFFDGAALYPGRHTPGSIYPDWLPLLDRECRRHGLVFGCSVFDEQTLEMYLDVDPAWIKIASPEAANRPLLEAAAMTGVPLLVSTGAMDEEDVCAAGDTLAGCDVTWLHCTSAYPAPPVEMDVRAMMWLPEPYGLSDHSLEPVVAPVLAVALGAVVIEKHITLDRTAAGPDHAFALEPGPFRNMVAAVRLAELMLGDGVKRVQPSEDPTDRRVP